LGGKDVVLNVKASKWLFSGGFLGGRHVFGSIQLQQNKGFIPIICMLIYYNFDPCPLIRVIGHSFRGANTTPSSPEFGVELNSMIR
jgi:hypothetical protein